MSEEMAQITSGTAPRRITAAVIGAGLSGLTAAYRLSQAGVETMVFEANPDRVGGRCWSAGREFGRLVGEHGGERIDTRHQQIQNLVAELGLSLEDHSDSDGQVHVVRAGATVQLDDVMSDRLMLKQILDDDMSRRGIACGGPLPVELPKAAQDLDTI